MDVKELRERAIVLEALGFNLHQARALVLLKEHWRPRLWQECPSARMAGRDVTAPVEAAPQTDN